MKDKVGTLFVISAPSGAGKTSLVEGLIEKFSLKKRPLLLSVSYTTRAPRKGEVDGSSYHFVSREKFIQMEGEGELLESAEVYGNLYGTGKRWVEDRLKKHWNIILEIDVQGALKVISQSARVCSIFVSPPSLDTLKHRLYKRGTDSESTITERLKQAEHEIAMNCHFAYHVMNQDFLEALEQIADIIEKNMTLDQIKPDGS